MFKRSIFSTLVLWAALLVSPSPSVSAPADVLVIAIPHIYPPYTQIDVNGQPAGMFVDIWNLWSKKTGREIDFQVNDWVNTLAALKSGSADIHSGLYYSADRDKWMDYSRSFYVNSSSFFHHPGDTPPPSDADLDGVKIGVVKGYLQETFLKEAYPKANVVALGDDEELIKALAADNIDLLLSEVPTIEALLPQMGMPGRIGSVGAPILTNDVYASVLEGRLKLLEEINAGLNQFTKAEWTEIEARWIKDPSKRFFGRVGNKTFKLTASERAWIAANPVIRTIALRNWPPIDFQDADGAHAGISAGILSLVARRVGLKVEPEFGSWAAMLEKLKKGEIDLAPEIYHTEERAKHLAYSRPYLPLYNAIFARSRGQKIETMVDLVGKAVAVEKSYALERTLKSDYPGVNPLVVNSTLDALKAVSIGKADAYVGSQYVASYLIDQNLLHGVKAVAHFGDKPQFLHMAVPKDRAILRDIMDKALGSISELEKREIVVRYVASDSGAAAKSVNLTDKERAWLHEHPILRLGVDPDWPPYDFINSQGKHAGLSADILHLLSDRLGLSFQLAKGLRWKEVMEKMQRKDLDVTSLCSQTKKRQAFIAFTSPLTTAQRVIISRNDHKAIGGPEDLIHKKVLVVKGYSIIERLKEKYPKLTLGEVDSALAGLEAVSAGNADAYIGNLGVSTNLIQENGLTNLVVAANAGLASQKLSICVRKDWPQLVGILNKGLASLTHGERRKIMNQWIPSLGQDSRDAPPEISLTNEERAYVMSHPQLQIGIDTAWPPFEFLDEDDKYSGIASSVTGMVSEISGMKMVPVKDLSWSQLLESAKNGKINLITMVQPTPERAKYLEFTKPYVSYPSVILTRDDAPFITGLDGLKGVRTGVGKGYSVEEFIRSNHPKIHLVPERDAAAVLQDLAAGKTDAAVTNLAVATYVIDKFKLTNLKIAAPTEFNIDLAMGVAKGETVLRDILQKSLDVITEDEMTAIKNRWVALRVSFGLDPKTVLIWAAPIGGSAVMIIVFVVIWNRRLGNEIYERKRAEESLKRAHHQITDSIDYAGLIQRSILPDDSDFEAHFEDHFVLWEPRDIVGGDIYWCKSWGKGLLVMLGDCTGHGVPGAFGTMIATGALDRALSETPEGNVSEVIQRMHQLICKMLGQDAGASESNDGLELGACYITSDKKRLIFAGARFDLFSAREGVVERYRGTRCGIGYPEVPLDQDFEEISLDIDSATSFYMTTDGLIDQIGISSQRRFGTKRFQALLNEVQTMDMGTQKDMLLKMSEEHRGSEPRFDDMAVIGFRFGL